MGGEEEEEEGKKWVTISSFSCPYTFS